MRTERVPGSPIGKLIVVVEDVMVADRLWLMSYDPNIIDDGCKSNKLPCASVSVVVVVVVTEAEVFLGLRYVK